MNNTGLYLVAQLWFIILALVILFVAIIYFLGQSKKKARKK